MARNYGTATVIALLVVVMLLTAGTSWEALRTARLHRLAAQQMIRDDASIIADDFIHRTIFEFEEIVSMTSRRLALDVLNRNPNATIADMRAEGLNPLAERFFVFDIRTKAIEPPLEEPLASWMGANLADTVEKRRGDLQTIKVHLADGDHLLVYGLAMMSEHKIFGFTMAKDTAAIVARRAFNRRSAFPGILGRGQLRNDAVFLSLSEGNHEIFRAGSAFVPEYGVTMRVGDRLSPSVAGMTMRSSIAPAAVPALVIGGVPQSRITFVAASLTATILALCTAIFVIRRERQLATMRSDFVSSVSHELQTPLTQIRMFAETLLLDRVRSEGERHRSLQIIDEEARRLGNLVDNVLFLARGERSALEVDPQDCDIGMLIEEAVEAYRPLAAQRDVNIVVDVPPALAACVDPSAWKQVLTNILDNAVKYGPAKQTIRVSATSNDGRLRVMIDDEGPGIPPDERDLIWRRFHRMKRDRETHRSGSGLGLAIVHDIVARHGGRCWVTDREEQGARFVIEVQERAS